MIYDDYADLERHRSEVEGLSGLIKHLGWNEKRRKLGLDIGGGDGLHAPWLLELADKLIISDIKNYLGDTEGLHASLIKQKLESFAPLDLSRIEFHYVDAHNVPYRNELFDFVVSINAFEHIPDPVKALNEIIRVTMPGALVVLQFDPLWYSPFGHHLWHLGMAPWEHLLMEDGDFEELIARHNGTYDDVEVFRNSMNRKSFSYYKKLFKDAEQNFSQTYFNYWAKNESEEPNLNHENFQKCIAAGFDELDLMVRGVQFLGIRKA